MKKIKFFTDSTADLSEYLIDRYNISIIPQIVNFDDESFRDGLDIKSSDLYKKIKETGYLPKTSAPTPFDFYQAFKDFADKDYQIVYVGLSSKLSTTFQNSIIGSEEFKDKVTLIDTQNLSTGIALILLKLIDLLEEGQELEEAVELIENDYIDKVNTSFMVDNFEYLYKGGRCSAIASIMGTTFKIKPIIEVKDGKLSIRKKARGKKNKIIDKQKKFIIDNIDSIDRKRLFITHSQAFEEAKSLKEELEKLDLFENIYITETGAVISCHCGPGTIGTLYLEK